MRDEQLLTSQARELQFLMEDEIESNNFEAAALLQGQIEWIHERCRRQQQQHSVRGCATSRPPHRTLNQSSRGLSAASGMEMEDDSVGACGQGTEDVPERRVAGGAEHGGGAGAGEGSSAAQDEVARRVELQERINALHHQLEAALGEEDFERCDTINADITTLTRQRDALLDR